MPTSNKLIGHRWPQPRDLEGHTYSLAEASRYLPISEGTLRKMCVRGEVPEAEDLRHVSMGWKIAGEHIPTIHARMCTAPAAEHEGGAGK